MPTILGVNAAGAPILLRLNDDGTIRIGAEDTTNGAMVVEQGQFDYETVAASQTDQVLGNTGALGDLIHALWAVPATTSPGAVTLKDGSGSAITLFTGGASSVADLKPFLLAVPQNGRSTDGAWKITTGANISVIASGRFTP